MVRARLFFFIFGLSGLALLAGCGLGGLAPLPGIPVQNPQPTSVLFVSVPTTIAVKASATIYAAAIYPSGSVGRCVDSLVTYSVSCASAGACGMLSASDEGGAIVYTAPAAVPSGGSVTITATSVADTSLSRSTRITVTPPIPISVSFFAPPPASLEVNSAVQLHARIDNDVAANPQVQWTVTCAASACGTFNPNPTFDEEGTLYTAPSAVPPESTVTVTATSLTDSTKSVSAILVITPQTATLADGTYVFQISTQPGNDASFITGVFVARGGAITGGEQDTVYYMQSSDGDGSESSSPYSTFQPVTGGTYSVAPDGTLAVSIQVGPYAAESLTGALASGSRGLISAIDGVPAGGSLDLQTSTAAPLGGYALSLYGGDASSSPMWLSGILNIDTPGAISGNGSILDAVEGAAAYGGIPNGMYSVGPSTVSAPDTFGRVLIQLNPTALSTLQTVSLGAYVVSSGQLRITGTVENMGYEPGIFLGVLGGTALRQGASTAKFTLATLAGTSYVFGAAGTDTRGTLQVAGVLTLNSDGSLSGTLNQNDLGGNAQDPQPFTGSFTVEPTGRVTLTGLSDGSTFNYNLRLYLTGDGGGLLLSNDANNIFIGQVYQQQSTAFTAESFSGTYGLNAALAHLETESAPAAGTVTVTPGSDADTMAGYADTGNGAMDFALSGSFAPAANGVFQGTITGLNPAARSTASSFTLYTVDGTQGVVIETDSAQLTLAHLQRLQ